MRRLSIVCIATMIILAVLNIFVFNNPVTVKFRWITIIQLVFAVIELIAAFLQSRKGSIVFMLVIFGAAGYFVATVAIPSFGPSSLTTITVQNGLYEGETVGGRAEGKGKVTWDAGDYYEGDFVNGKMSGKGKYTFTNGTFYEGDFVDDAMTGIGKLVFTWEADENNNLDHLYSFISMMNNYFYSIVRSERIEDAIVNGIDKLNTDLDNGKLGYFVSRCIYEGGFIDGKFNGKGKLTSNPETIWETVYEGDFTNDKQTGYGKEKRLDVHKDEETGVSKLNSDEFLIYEGDFVDGEWNGKGVFTNCMGDVFECLWVDGLKEGRGIVTHADGCVTEGNWLNGKLDGVITITNPDGIKHTHTYIDGELHE